MERPAIRTRPFSVFQRQFFGVFSSHDKTAVMTFLSRVFRVNGDERSSVHGRLVFHLSRNDRQPTSEMDIAKA